MENEQEGNMHQVELSEEDIDIASYALSELARHQEGVADEIYGLTGLEPNAKECRAYLARAKAARDALDKLKVRVRRAKY
jgi:hypothetical protein